MILHCKFGRSTSRMHWIIADIRGELQIDGNTYLDILADEIIIEANKLGIVESLFVLIENTSSLTN